MEVARGLDVSMVITLGALLADVPHTRPVSVTGIASDASLVARLGFEGTSYEGPTGITGVLHHACAAAKLPSVSLWASVPHYVAASPNPKVALALVRAFEGAAGVVIDARRARERRGGLRAPGRARRWRATRRCAGTSSGSSPRRTT